MSAPEVTDIFERIKAMSLPDRLRFAAGLLEQTEKHPSRATLHGMVRSILDRCSGEIALREIRVAAPPR